MTALITFISCSFLFFVIYLIKNRLPRLRQTVIFDQRKVRSALLYSCLSIFAGGLAWFYPEKKWLSLVASAISLTAISLFFNTMQQWFSKTQHKKIKKEDLIAVGLWLLWLLSVSVFSANIFVCLL